MNSCIWCDPEHGPCDQHVTKEKVIECLNHAHRVNRELEQTISSLKNTVEKLEKELKTVKLALICPASDYSHRCIRCDSEVET